MHTLSLTQPDDWHLHLRDDAAMRSVVGATARCFGRAVIMPNLKPPVTTVAAALAYRQRIIEALAPDSTFQPLMTLYLTDNTKAEEILKLKQTETIVAVKYYPSGATTNSDSGVSALAKVYPVLAELEKQDVPLLIHGEVTDPQVDIFDREKIFIETVLTQIMRDFPALRIVLEHITTRDAVEFINQQSVHPLAATLTAHHLLMNRNAIFTGGVRPHHYCLPVLKREQHRQALLSAATSGNPRFFLGTDSAPHSQSSKESSCGCAGMYTAPAAIELYAEAFEQVNALDKLEGFASFYGADFYGLPRNQSTITLKKQAWTLPQAFPFATEQVIPLRAGETITWQVSQF